MLKADKHFFWSGGHLERVPGKTNPDKYLGSMEDKATRIAKQHGGNSEAGKTHVVFPGHPGQGHDVYPYRRPDNVFDETEYPRLKQDGKGDSTKFHDRTGYERPYRAPS